MKTKSSISLAAMVMSFLLTSCSHYYYAPNMVNAPLFQKKNETRLNVAESSGAAVASFELQGAHAFTNHVAGMFNFATGGSSDEYGDRTHSTYGEVGAGYFYPFAKHFVAEGYSGLGLGGVRNEYGSSSSYSGVTYLKPWIQPDIGVRFSVFELALSSRFALLNYVSVQSSAVPSEQQFEFNLLEDFKTSFLVEPAVTMRVGWKYAQFQIQYGESVNSVPLFPQEYYNINIGLIFTIPPPKTNSTKYHSL